MIATRSTTAPDPKSLLAATAPSVTSAEAAALALQHFSIAGTAEPLPGERDSNFRITAQDGTAVVLKVANAAEETGLGEFQQAALLHVAAKDPALPVPRACITRDGAVEAIVTLYGGSRHSLRMMTYLPGLPMPSGAASVTQASAIGTALAALGAALSDFDHPRAEHDILWDLEQASGLRPLLPHIAVAATRDRARTVLDRYEDVVRPRMAGFRRQVVHNDLNPSNILLDPSNPTRLAGILDFGDMVRTALVNDIAVAAAYHVGGDDPLARPLALVAGYHARAPLRPEEAECLIDLIALRLVFTLTIGAWRADLHPENKPYVLRHQARATAALGQLSTIEAASGARRFRDTCRLRSDT